MYHLLFKSKVLHRYVTESPKISLSGSSKQAPPTLFFTHSFLFCCIHPNYLQQLNHKRNEGYDYAGAG